MSSTAITLLTYVWHYVVARILYDQVVRPVSHGRGSEVALVVVVAALGFLVGRVTKRRG